MYLVRYMYLGDVSIFDDPLPYQLLTNLFQLHYAVADVAIAVDCLNPQLNPGILKSVISHFSSPCIAPSRGSEIPQFCPHVSVRESKSNGKLVYRAPTGVG